jgi:predicted phage terminase large subunit-like protein
MTQQQQLPMPTDGEAYFPVNQKYPTWISRDNFTRHVRVAGFEISVDTAEVVNKKADNTVIVVAAWSSTGKCYIDKIIMGQFLPDQTIGHIIREAMLRYNHLRSIKIEETGYVRGMKSSLERQLHLNGIYLPITFIKRDNKTAKEERIAQTLQPPYTRGDLIFVDDLGLKKDSEEFARTKEELITELGNFPAARHDDILDAISDLWQNKEWQGREFARRTLTQERDLAMERLIGLQDDLPGPASGPRLFTV